MEYDHPGKHSPAWLLSHNVIGYEDSKCYRCVLIHLLAQLNGLLLFVKLLVVQSFCPYQFRLQAQIHTNSHRFAKVGQIFHK